MTSLTEQIAALEKWAAESEKQGSLTDFKYTAMETIRTLHAQATQLAEALEECHDQLWHLAKDPKTNWWVNQAKAALTAYRKAQGEV